MNATEGQLLFQRVIASPKFRHPEIAAYPLFRPSPQMGKEFSCGWRRAGAQMERSATCLRFAEREHGWADRRQVPAILCRITPVSGPARVSGQEFGRSKGPRR